MVAQQLIQSCVERVTSGCREISRRHPHRRLPLAFRQTRNVRHAVMTNIACQLEHSVEAEVAPSFAWNWRTDIKNWDDPPAQFQLDGPFAKGSWGTTRLPGQVPMRWQIRDVRLGTSFIIEMPLDRAVLSFEWVFDAISNGRTRITQRIVLSGDNATAYADQVRAGFGSTLPDGMKRIADALVRAAGSMDGGNDR